MQRPLFANKLVELEQVFEESKNSLERLALLFDELTHRKTARAVALRNKVAATISDLLQGVPVKNAVAIPDASIVPAHRRADPVCERCGSRPRVAKQRYCNTCKKLVLAELRESGYLTPKPFTVYRSPDTQELVRETKFGRDG